MTKKERVASAVLNATIDSDIREQDGHFYINNIHFDDLEKLNEYIDRLEDLTILARTAEELGLVYGYDGHFFKVQLRLWEVTSRGNSV